MSRPTVFVPSAEGNPCRSCTAHNPDDDHLRAAHPPAHGLPVPCDGAAFVLEQLDTHLQVSDPRSPSSPAGCALRARRNSARPNFRGAIAQPARPGRDESVIYVQAIVRTTSRPAGGPAEPSPSPHHLPSFTSHFRNVFRAELCTTNQPSLSQPVLEPNLLGEGSSSNARGLNRSRS